MKFVFIFFFALLLAVAGAIYLNEKGVISLKKIMPQDIGSSSEVQKLPIEREAPELAGIESWINSEPLSLAGLRGKVVLVDFWTYTCINCIRTFPHISGWHEKYKDKGLVILGIHSPEFNFEKDRENVLREVKKYNINYPVALDNDHKTWNAFANRYWPAEYLIDVDGNIRYHHFGEGRYDETEKAIQQLLLEGGLISVNDTAEVSEADSSVDFGKIGTPEVYLGYLRINNLGNSEVDVPANIPYTFTEPKDVVLNRFYFAGTWNIEAEFAEFVGDEGKLIIRYKANKINMVLSTKDNVEVPLELKLDGEYLTEDNKGADVLIENGKSVSEVSSSGFYNFVDTGDDYDWHTLEIIITSPGLLAFTFTFG